jgi:hypothetical protein
MNREDLIMYEYGSSLTGEEKRFIEMDLGKGVDCLGPNYDMLDLQVVPSPSSLAYSTMGCGYCSFKKTVRDWSKISRTMYRNASTPSGRPVSLDIGINGNREKESRMSYTCEGEMVRTKTIRFAIAAPVKEDTINLRRESYRYGKLLLEILANHAVVDRCISFIERNKTRKREVAARPWATRLVALAEGRYMRDRPPFIHLTNPA